MTKKISIILICTILYFNQAVAFSLLPFWSSLKNDTEEDIFCSSYERKGEIISISPRCVLNHKLPNFTLKDKADAVVGAISKLGKGYDHTKESATYNSENLTIDTKEQLYPLDTTMKDILNKASKEHKNIEIPLKAYAGEILQDLAFYISEKDISKLQPCTKQNYLLAFENLDGKVLESKTSFNFNSYLFKLKGYCAGQTEEDLKFYGGVCGVASQIFRTALTTPTISIPIRHNHTERFSVYYGNKIQGDDAAVYETSKQLIIENTSNYDIIMKTYQNRLMTYLIFITPKEATLNQRVEITKDYVSPLHITLNRNVYKKEEIDLSSSYSFIPLLPNLFKKRESSLKFSEIFDSYYTGINDGNR